MSDRVAFSEEGFDERQNKGKETTENMEGSIQGLNADFSLILDESGGDIANEFNNYVRNELNPELNRYLQSFEQEDEAIRKAASGFSGAKETAMGVIQQNKD